MTISEIAAQMGVTPETLVQEMKTEIQRMQERMT